MIRTRGSWGVSHTRVPTESRPGHVALFAGMYEDSSSSFLFGSPDIVPMFARHVPQAREEHYSHEEEDFAKGDASELDIWAFRHFQKLLEKSKSDQKLSHQLHDDGVVVFCHYLGIDSNGHAHRPNSKDYLNNIALVDELVEKTYRMVEEFYEYDGRTAYVFTADHGMGLKGAHGDGDPANTRTPLVVWGAGVQEPTVVETKNSGFEIDLPTQSRAQVRAQLQAQEEQEHAAKSEWGALDKLVRKDVMQADVAPLISALLGLPYPRNSVGVLPFSYLAKGAYRANAVRSNAQQLYLHALRKEQEKRSRTLLRFVPYGPFRDRIPELSKQLVEAYDASIANERLEENSDAYERVEVLSQELIEICLDTLEYFQRYDWFFLLSIVVLGYVGWMIVVGVAYLHPQDFRVSWLLGARGKQVDIKLCIMVFAVFMYLALEGSPITYYLYVLFPLLFGVFTWNHADLIHETWTSSASGSHAKSSWKWWAERALIMLCLELVVIGYERREIFGVLFSLLALWPFVGTSTREGDGQVRGGIRSFPSPSQCWSVSCLLISVFPYLPSEYGEHTALVNIGGVLVLLFAGMVLTMAGLSQQKIWTNPSFILSITPLALSLVTLHYTMQYLDGERSKPPFLLTAANWVLASLPIVVLLVKLQKGIAGQSRILETGAGRYDPQLQQAEVGRYVTRIIDVILAFAPSFTLLSIAYEVLFYVVLCGVLVSWLLLEAETSFTSSTSTWREVQRAFVFLLLVNIAFFGTGNVASMSSFEISSTYRFVTVFAPFTMGALLVGKILIPFMVVACTFHLILLLPSASSAGSQKPRLPASRYFLLVVAMSDVLALHFLFLVKNEGSWKEIGNSISMFGIVNAQIVFIPLLFLLARAFVRDLTPATGLSGQSLQDKKRQ
ncbi:hypothetical protein BBO99_00001364 [Phytophthora kernoviae]|uniref:GPI ethanolamine phosphate transferase 1 n=2 Tax=Phytophthora kernoviae TaxID=325452 RepID=A0A3R7J234_9STRA|nr:hypothetical protein G195_002351 [Phytophthora kernoviae 00238/432]KAG2522852.1 hypothetical protein JM16_005605 [Phytophthora kernoviae]KAG2530778.1 hypothetical protein JM18_001197 [Phytophthora kernoviae]RLN10282.1 hypothetical protein BBI17_001146 [Phytophthora kernoviae]RLN84428.1 hypothetical protein BBO99_00001364 [Phytophthora kernoviae]